jgi:hypothetical protein
VERASTEGPWSNLKVRGSPISGFHGGPVEKGFDSLSRVPCRAHVLDFEMIMQGPKRAGGSAGGGGGGSGPRKMVVQMSASKPRVVWACAGGMEVHHACHGVAGKPTLPADFEERTWSMLAASVRAVQTMTPVEWSYEELYRWGAAARQPERALYFFHACEHRGCDHAAPWRTCASTSLGRASWGAWRACATHTLLT